MAPSGSGDEGGAILHTFAKASHSLSSSEEWELGVACEAGKEVLATTAQELVEEASGLPILCSRSCDGTPLLVGVRLGVAAPLGKKRVTMHTKSAMELLVKNEFLRCRLPDGHLRTRVVLREATSLEYWEICPSYIGSLQCGVEVYSADGGMQGPRSSTMCSTGVGIPHWSA